MTSDVVSNANMPTYIVAQRSDDSNTKYVLPLGDVLQELSARKSVDGALRNASLADGLQTMIEEGRV